MLPALISEDMSSCTGMKERQGAAPCAFMIEGRGDASLGGNKKGGARSHLLSRRAIKSAWSLVRSLPKIGGGAYVHAFEEVSQSIPGARHRLHNEACECSEGGCVHQRESRYPARRKETLKTRTSLCDCNQSSSRELETNLDSITRQTWRQSSYRGDGDPALELAGGHVIAPLDLDGGAALPGNLADRLTALADDGAYNRVIHEQFHASNNLRRARETRRTELADGGELIMFSKVGGNGNRWEDVDEAGFETVAASRCHETTAMVAAAKARKHRLLQDVQDAIKRVQVSRGYKPIGNCSDDQEVQI